jgi:hypothetical protein
MGKLAQEPHSAAKRAGEIVPKIRCPVSESITTCLPHLAISSQNGEVGGGAEIRPHTSSLLRHSRQL